jgi:hypothetical protein
MNNITKTGMGLLIAVLAFGFSAFTTLKTTGVYTYYKTSLTYPDADDPKDYRYYAGDRCTDGGNLCSANWDIGANAAPSEGDPLPISGAVFQSESATRGHFE